MPTGTPDVVINLCETNNHTIETYPGSVNQTYLLNIFNSLHYLTDSQHLDHMRDQTINIIGNILGIWQPLGAPDQTVDLSETNNHTLMSFPFSISYNSVLEIHNSNGDLLDSVLLGFMNDQTLSYDAVGAPNTVCISQPSPLPDQCVDLTRVNNQ